MIPFADALDKVTGSVDRLAAEQVPLADALGRVLAEDVASRTSNPPAAVSSMDGYAVRAADLAQPGGTLTRVGESAAGVPFPGLVEVGQCVRIFTGAPLPDGADAVEMQENTAVDGDTITFSEAVAEGRFVRPAGLDFAAGDVLLPAGRVLTARDLGLLAAMDVPWLSVRRRPRVAVLATGNELAMPGEPREEGQIPNANGIAVCAYVRALGGEPVDLGIARDTEDSLHERLAAARGCDLLVTIGGASVGDYDLVQDALGAEGFDLGFYKVAIRPGKPLIYGRAGGMPVLGLPGNPVSAGVTAILFLQPMMQVMLGTWAGPPRPETARLGADLPANDQRRDYLRGTLSVDAEGRLTATPFPAQDSAMMARLADADCLLIRAPHAPPAAAGEPVEILRLRGAGLLSL